MAAETGVLVGLTGPSPGDFGPVLEREEVMIAAREVGAQDQCEFARWARCGKRAHFAAASGAEVAAPRRPGMACAERGHTVNNARWEPHHEKRRLDCRFRLSRIIRGESGWRSGGSHEKLTIVNFIQGDGVGLGRWKGRVGPGDKGDEDGNLSRKANDAAHDMCGG